MRRNIIVALIFILLISTLSTGAFAKELFTDFISGTESIDSSVWTEDLSEFSSTSAIDTSGRYTASGNITKGKSILLEADISAAKNNDIIRIEYDVNPNIKRNKGEQRSYLKIGSDEYLLVRFRRVSVDGVSTAGYNIYFSTDGNPVYVDTTGESKGKWYRIATEFNKITENVSISIKDYSAGENLASKNIPFSTFFKTSDEAAAYKNSGFDALKFNALADSSKDTSVNILYRMVKVVSVPNVKEITLKDLQLGTEISDTAYVGQEIQADVVLNDDTAEKTVEWYRVGENDAVGSDNTYILTSTDVGKQIYAKVTPKDSDTTGSAAKSDSINAVLFKAYQNTDITKETIEFFTLIDTDTLTPENVTLTPGDIKPISITTEDKKVFTLNFEEGALDYNTEYTISISGAAFENTDLCTGTVSFATRLAPGIVLTKNSGRTEGKISFMSEIKLSTNENAEALYEGMNVYAQLVRDGNVIRTNSFVIDVEKGNEYVLKAAFFKPLESDSIRWICEKDSAEISNAITLACKEEE